MRHLFVVDRRDMVSPRFKDRQNRQSHRVGGLAGRMFSRAVTPCAGSPSARRGSHRSNSRRKVGATGSTTWATMHREAHRPHILRSHSRCQCKSPRVRNAATTIRSPLT
jgi:hypothetical protein